MGGLQQIPPSRSEGSYPRGVCAVYAGATGERNRRDQSFWWTQSISIPFPSAHHGRDGPVGEARMPAGNENSNPFQAKVLWDE